ncbi:hypothetical protein HMPREF9134_00060 [Porphyromonas catoniae F0037]|uniref:Uncharacterized protein n=1 Tax=Porphyromonas catoniae F0037 TaxID=1127696 RepID=L1NIQ6_9PORP|nr:hypothetical protein HMPREF9134_00060 [Porphyromonas catoniae F0037]
MVTLSISFTLSLHCSGAEGQEHTKANSQALRIGESYGSNGSETGCA